MNEGSAMKKILIGMSVLLAGMVCASQAMAWRGANRFGGATQHTWGATAHENRWGGSSEHVAGEGTEHTNAWGGDTAHAWGGGTEHTNVYGGKTYGAAGEGVAHTYPGGATAYRPPGYPAYPVYHPPVAVPVYASGCYGCAAAAGAVVGVAAGAAIASANTAAATSNAYAVGVAAGASASAPPPPRPPARYALGANYATLPAGCTNATVGGTVYYLCGNTWFKPMYGANGVYYRVAPTP